MPDELEKEFQKYSDFVDAYAEQKFNEVVLPYLKKYSLTFLAGNGTYYVGTTELSPKWYLRTHRNGACCGNQVETDMLPKKIKDVLSIEIPGMRYNDLGSLMPDYDPEGETE